LARQFDIVRNLNSVSRTNYPFLLVLQHDRVESLQSVIVAPLVLVDARTGKSRLHPAIDVPGRSYVVKMEDIAATPRNVIGAIVGSAITSRYEIVAALDLLFTGI
jgi:toxin CcdB